MDVTIPIILNRVELAYAAGFIDGEGYIGVYDRSGSRSFHFVLVVSNSDPRPLEWFQDRFGGKVIEHRNSNPRAKLAYRWQVTSERAEAVIRAVMPYLIVKRERALLALEFRETYWCETDERFSPDAVSKRRRIAARLKVLNHRGVLVHT